MAAALAAATAAGALAGCGGPPVEVVDMRPAMHTLVTIRVVARDREAAGRALRAAWDELELCERKLNRYAPDSDVSHLNQDAGTGVHIRVEPLVTSCLAAAEEVHRLTDGAFDPTIGPVVDLWRRAEQKGALPTEQEIDAARGLVGMDRILIEVVLAQRTGLEDAPVPPGRAWPPEEREPEPWHLAALPEKGMALDLGGIAKGYAAGRMMRRMERVGIVAAMVNAGGDIYAVGRRPAALLKPGADGRWHVSVHDPRYPLDEGVIVPAKHRHPYTVLRISDQAVVTSGHYERGYRIAGRRCSHILDPRTGRPVNPRLASVTVVAPDPAMADGLATALAVLGVEKGLDLVEKLAGVECLLLEVVPEDEQAAEAEPADPERLRLIAHRSTGFAALEVRPAEPPPPEK